VAKIERKGQKNAGSPSWGDKESITCLLGLAVRGRPSPKKTAWTGLGEKKNVWETDYRGDVAGIGLGG